MKLPAVLSSTVPVGVIFNISPPEREKGGIKVRRVIVRKTFQNQGRIRCLLSVGVAFIPVQLSLSGHSHLADFLRRALFVEV